MYRPMETISSELFRGIPETETLVRFLVRILAAVVFGSLIGLQRASVGKAAGMRTHVLVSTGTCLFVVAAIGGGFGDDAISRIVQGIVTGIGFIGAGTIVKGDQEGRVQGLTTASGIWMTSGIGVVTGLGMVGLGFIGTIITLVILMLSERFEVMMHIKKPKAGE